MNRAVKVYFYCPQGAYNTIVEGRRLVRRVFRCGTETPPLLRILATNDTPIRREIGPEPHPLEEVLCKELEKEKKRVGPRRSPPSL